MKVREEVRRTQEHSAAEIAVLAKRKKAAEARRKSRNGEGPNSGKGAAETMIHLLYL